MTNAICSVDDCDRPRAYRELCKMHYRRLRKHGSTDMPPTRTLEGRFWAKVQKTETCWLWTASQNDHGYGTIGRGGVGGARVGAHRVAYELLVGPIPTDQEIDHICHVRHCVNPDHLRVVTRPQNLQNRSVVRGASGVRNVDYDKRDGRWSAYIKFAGKKVHLGRYASLDEADRVATAARLKYYTHNDHDRDNRQAS